jgi:two-component response regulator (ARR-A family)
MDKPSLAPKKDAAPMPVFSSRPELLVLHVDDCLEDQLLFQNAARQAGVPIRWDVADCPAHAFSYFERLLSLASPAPAVWPGVVLLDLVMPGGNGTMVIEFMRKNHQLCHIPIVVFSGTPSPAILAQTAALSPTLLLPKPLFFRELVDLVTQIYDRFGNKNDARPDLRGD